MIDARLRKQDRELIPAIRIDSIRYDTIPYDTAILTWAANQLSLPHVTKTKTKTKKNTNLKSKSSGLPHACNRAKFGRSMSKHRVYLLRSAEKLDPLSIKAAAIDYFLD